VSGYEVVITVTHDLPEIASDEPMHELDGACWCDPDIEVSLDGNRRVRHRAT
jgi:hypothetical protein